MKMSTASATTRKRGRGETPEARKFSRAAFKAHDTRREMAAIERKRRKKIARKAAATRAAKRG